MSWETTLVSIYLNLQRNILPFWSGVPIITAMDIVTLVLFFWPNGNDNLQLISPSNDTEDFIYWSASSCKSSSSMPNATWSCSQTNQSVMLPGYGESCPVISLIGLNHSFEYSGFRTLTRSPLKCRYFHLFWYFFSTIFWLSAWPNFSKALAILLTVSSSGFTPNSSISANTWVLHWLINRI